ncbi:MAG: response regulator transcription factor [Oscillospiraceae bacterium]|nr:response regulator transcription factor [Oscillospiraceae bacterium]
MKKILIIEDDTDIAELERDYLEMNGFICDIALNGKDGLEKSLDNDYSLIVADIMLPDINGFDICQRLRTKKQTPVMFLSARSDDISKVRGLGLGADDYMTKPFSPNEFVARIRAHISRFERLSGNMSSGAITVRNLKINKASHKVYVNDSEIILPNKEFDLLLFLAQNPNITFSKDMLFDRVWGLDALGDISTVTVHIQRIRDKIETDNDKYIETVWGVGYRFRG